MNKCENCPDVYSGECTGRCMPYVSSWTLGLRTREPIAKRTSIKMSIKKDKRGITMIFRRIRK